MTATGAAGNLTVHLGVSVEPWVYKQRVPGVVGQRTAGPRVVVLQVVEGRCAVNGLLFASFCSLCPRHVVLDLHVHSHTWKMMKAGRWTVCFGVSIEPWVCQQWLAGVRGQRTPVPRVVVLQFVEGVQMWQSVALET